MKLGPIRISMASVPEVHVKEQGSTGSVFGKGSSADFGAGILLNQDYNADLQGVKLYDEIDRMRLSDSVVKGMLGAIKKPLLGADWHFEPGDESPEQEAITAWLNAEVTDEPNRMNWSWATVLRHMLLYLDYGVMPFEPVFEIRDDLTFNRPMACLRKLAPRMPRTITEWIVDENGGLAGVTQQVSIPDGIKTVSIPIENLLVFIHELEGSNYRGISLLRAARKDWYYKDKLQRLAGIILEKRGAGIDVGKLTRGDESKKRQAERVLMDVRSHERAFVLETEDFEYRIEGAGAGKTLDPLPWVQYYDLSMLRGVAAEFLAMGDGSGGSFAMHADKTSLFLMGLLSVGSDITSVFNRHLVKRWCDMNWPGLMVYPKLVHSRLDRRDATKVVDALTKLIPQKVITIEPQLEVELRELLELPEFEPPEGSGKSPQEDPPKPDKESDAVQARRTKPVDSVDWVALAAGMDDGQQSIVDAVVAIQARQIDVLVREAIKRMRAGKLSLDDITVPYKQEAADAIAEVLVHIYRLGQKEATKEIQAAFLRAGLVRAQEPLDPDSEPVVNGFLAARAKMMASVLAERLRGSLLRNALDMFRTGEVDEEDLKAKLSDLSDRSVSTEAGLSVSEAFNLGRESVAKANAEHIKRAEYSALLDEGTCRFCEEQDGKTFAYGSAAMEEVRPPYKKCLGRGRCRCVLVFVLEGEQ